MGARTPGGAAGAQCQGQRARASLPGQGYVVAVQCPGGELALLMRGHGTCQAQAGSLCVGGSKPVFLNRHPGIFA